MRCLLKVTDFKVIWHVNLTSIFSKAYSTATQSLKSLPIPKNSIHAYKIISHDSTPQKPQRTRSAGTIKLKNKF